MNLIYFRYIFAAIQIELKYEKANIQDWVNIISGGFPCQDISVAGKMEGIAGTRSGLWGEMFRVIRKIRPEYVIIENSPALLIRGFERILCDLYQIGYDVEWQCISNNAFGYPHKRERVYAIAYTNQERLQSNVQKQNGFKSIFREWTPNKNDGFIMSQRIHKKPACEYIRNGNGFQNWTHRVQSIGNSVNPTIAYYLFDCIIQHRNQL